MPRSRINGNFIDKTFSIVANILLRIIPTTSGEKEAFTYYLQRWCDLIIFFTDLSLMRKTHYFIRKKMAKNRRLLKVKFTNKKEIPSVVYPRLMQPHMLQL